MSLIPAPAPTSTPLSPLHAELSTASSPTYATVHPSHHYTTINAAGFRRDSLVDRKRRIAEAFNQRPCCNHLRKDEVLSQLSGAQALCTIAGVRCLIDGAPTCCMAARVSLRMISRTRSTPG